MTAPREPPPHPAADEAAGGCPLVVALAAAQVVSWGSVYYSFSLLVVPMEQDLGWSRTALNGALSLGLLTAGICAYSVGAWIDRRGGRAIMTAGTILGAALLALWSQIETPAALYALWVGLGLSMAATLYEPVFVVLARRFPRSYRTRIAVVTFIAGFSSTVFVPLTQFLIDRFGWREALLALAAINLAVCLPIHALWLRDGPHLGAATATASDLGAESRDAVRRALRHPVFWALAASLTTYYATFSALTFHLIPLLVERMGGAKIIKARILRTCAVGESNVDRGIGDLMTERNPTVGLSAHAGQTDVRITAKADTETEADALIALMETRLRERLGVAIYGVDKETVPEVVGRLLLEKGWKLGVIDTLTGGQLGRELVEAGFGQLLATHLTLASPAEAAAAVGLAAALADGAAFAASLAQAVTPIEGVGLAILGPLSDDVEDRLTFIAVHGPAELNLTQRGRNFQDTDHTRRWMVVQGLDWVRRAALGLLSSPVDWN